HAGHLFMQMEHLDISVYGYTAFNWLYGIALAAVIEFIILIFIINGYRNTGKFYAVVSFFLNAFYYDYWFETIQNATLVNIKLTSISFLICLVHSLSVWQLSELFFKRLAGEKEKVVEHWCPECEAGPFPISGRWTGMFRRHINLPGKARKTAFLRQKPMKLNSINCNPNNYEELA
ncbi:hypothetical protein KK062_29475, partial [Fulvivirgaceae bacterium PWU5]